MNFKESYFELQYFFPSQELVNQIKSTASKNQLFIIKFSAFKNNKESWRF
jgi:hypothetical protein